MVAPHPSEQATTSVRPLVRLRMYTPVEAFPCYLFSAHRTVKEAGSLFSSAQDGSQVSPNKSMMPPHAGVGIVFQGTSDGGLAVTILAAFHPSLAVIQWACSPSHVRDAVVPFRGVSLMIFFLRSSPFCLVDLQQSVVKYMLEIGYCSSTRRQ